MHHSVGENLRRHFGVASLEGFGLRGQPGGYMCRRRPLAYVCRERRRPGEMRSLHAYTLGAFMTLDEATRAVPTHGDHARRRYAWEPADVSD